MNDIANVKVHLRTLSGNINMCKFNAEFNTGTLIQSYKRTPNIFYASSKSKNQLMYFFFISLYKSRLCRGSKIYFISKRRKRLARTKSE